MAPPSEAFTDLLSGKSPEAMYDALHAGRFLSDQALERPSAVLELIKSALLSCRQRLLAPPTKLKRLAQALVESGCLSERGISVYNGEIDQPPLENH